MDPGNGTCAASHTHRKKHIEGENCTSEGHVGGLTSSYLMRTELFD